MSSSRNSSRRKTFHSLRGRPGWRKRHKVFLTFQNLEQRWLMATFSVVNTNDSGAGSLRQAIIDSNAAPGSNTIDFDILPSGAHTISLASPLPSITVPVTIDGTTEPGYSGTPLIDLDGTSAGPGAAGLDLEAGSDGSTIRALVINNFTDDGVFIASSDNTVESSYIGTNAAGTAAGSQPILFGVAVTGANNTIGGATAGAGNVISGNTTFGVDIGAGTGNAVEGNLIGTDYTGTVAIGNGTGVEIDTDASGNTIGGLTATPGTAAGNVISGNYDAGVEVVEAGGNLIEGNLIGTDTTGSTALGNDNYGVELAGGAE